MKATSLVSIESLKPGDYFIATLGFKGHSVSGVFLLQEHVEEKMQNGDDEVIVKFAKCSWQTGGEVGRVQNLSPIFGYTLVIQVVEGACLADTLEVFGD